MTDFEDGARSRGFTTLVGIDEAGRGPLAGPVVASAVSLESIPLSVPIRDSKKMTPRQRDAAFGEICANAKVGVGIVSEQAIDHLNILQATYLAMHQAVADLLVALRKDDPDFQEGPKTLLIVDGHQFKPIPRIPYQTVIGGDKKVYTVACASIVAKVIRDRILTMYDRVFPEYGFAKHKGYGTVQHKAALNQHGRCPIHRRSFSF